MTATKAYLLKPRKSAPFVSARHALDWYVRAIEKHGSPKTGLAIAIAHLQNGTLGVMGGNGSVVEYELSLAVDVRACLPMAGPKDDPDDVAAWLAFRVGFLEGGTVSDCGEAVRRHLDQGCTWERARGLLSRSLRRFDAALRHKGLVA